MTNHKSHEVPVVREDGAVTAGVADAAAEHAESDITVVEVGTFAAGQSAQGRYSIVAGAPQSSFATTEDEVASPSETDAPRRGSKF